MTRIFLIFNEFPICVIFSNRCNQRFLDFFSNLSFGALTELVFSTSANLSLGILNQKLAYRVRKTKF